MLETPDREFSHGGHGKDLLEDMEWVRGGSRNGQFSNRSCRKVRRFHRQSGFGEPLCAADPARG